MIAYPSLPEHVIDKIKGYRAETFFLKNHSNLTTPEKAIEFANQCGFLFFWPIKDIILPSLWVACAGDRPVPNEHDDPGHITWGWKDSLLGKRKWYYGRILHKRNAIISLDLTPYFYALSENFGDFEQDYLIQYEEGRMTLEARFVYEALLKEGPLDTISLRNKAHLSGSKSDSRFNAALTDLMTDFKILPVGISDAGTWHYAYTYDIVARHMPDLVEKARYIQEPVARKRIIGQYINLVGVAQIKDISRLFGWPLETIEKVLVRLVTEKVIRKGLPDTIQYENWFFSTKIIN
jgi:hypothetical protein